MVFWGSYPPVVQYNTWKISTIFSSFRQRSVSIYGRRTIKCSDHERSVLISSDSLNAVINEKQTIVVVFKKVTDYPWCQALWEEYGECDCCILNVSKYKHRVDNDCANIEILSTIIAQYKTRLENQRKRKDNICTLWFDELMRSSGLTAACNNPRYDLPSYALIFSLPPPLANKFHVKPYLLPLSITTILQ